MPQPHDPIEGTARAIVSEEPAGASRAHPAGEKKSQAAAQGRQEAKKQAMTPTERACRMMRTVIHRSYKPGERFHDPLRAHPMLRYRHQGGRGAVRRLVIEGLLTGPRGQYVNPFSLDQQRRRARQLCEHASDLRREALELMRTAREVELLLGAESVPAGE
ncbi:hypothetical protein ABZW47_31295 [Streptomyces sp. NPDC004549]|uniref:hypothetical protein n=1 Tax=Streptomyces sp. NPDC004549 TaxID=3154283 RepID=UPI0033B5D2BF